MREGDWVRWTLDLAFVKEGRILLVKGPSMVIQFLGHDEPTVIPIVDQYLERGELVVIAEPPKAAQIERAAEADMMTPARAAAFLGITEKRLRVYLREGKLKGMRENGRWVEVVSGLEELSQIESQELTDTP